MQEFKASEYLKMDIATNFNKKLEKANWDVRLKWFEENEDKLDTLVDKASRPAMYFAGVNAYKSFKSKTPSGYPISLDATSSGLQVMAAITQCELSMRLCNVLPGDCKNAYMEIYKEMQKSIQKELDPDAVKDAVMTGFYGSVKVPMTVFGEKLYPEFLKTLDRVAPGPWELTQLMLNNWDSTALSHSWVLPDNYHAHVKVEKKVVRQAKLGKNVYEIIQEVNAPKQRGKSLAANLIHSIDGLIARELTRRCDYDVNQINQIKKWTTGFNLASGIPCEEDEKVKQLWQHYLESGYLSARILDFIRPSNILYIENLEVLWKLLESLPKRPFKIMAVHDCFRVLPNYGNDIRKQYNLQLAQIYNSDLLGVLVPQVLKKELTVYSDKNEHIYNQILKADYALA